MTQTPHLNIPLLHASQSQKHVTHNEALMILDAVVHIQCETKDQNTPPVNPEAGERHIVGAEPMDEWIGEALNIAVWQDGIWRFYSPNPGWLTWVSSESLLHVWTGTSWSEINKSSESSNALTVLGVNATADAVNRLAVSAEASLFNHEGAGHQIKLNKNQTTDTVSLLFQTGFSGRAELGLTGDDNFHFKVSSDGTNWTDAFNLRAASGNLMFQTSQDMHIINIGGDRTLNFVGGIAHIKTGGNSLTVNDGGTIQLMTTNIRVNGFDAGAMLNIQSAASTKVPLILKAAHSGQLVDFFRIQDENSASIFELDKDGNIAVTDTVSNDVTRVLKLYHNSTSSVSEGVGCGILFQADNSGNNKQSLGTIDMLATDVSGYFTADFVVRLNQNAISPAEVFRIRSNGNVGIGKANPTTRLDVDGMMRLKPILQAELPSAVSVGSGALTFLSDAPGGPAHAYSDGVNWRYIKNGLIV